jgi:transketolase
VFLGDGCLMEGISHEACALAGAWKLNKLTVLYDDNGISIDGAVKPWYVDDVAGRFRAQGWQVLGPLDGHDAEAVSAVLDQARASAIQPTLVICKTVIGKGSPNRAGTAKAHGEALGADEISLTRQSLGWNHEPFVVPEAAYSAWDARAAGSAAQAEWDHRLSAYRREHPDLAEEFLRRVHGELPVDFDRIASEALQAVHAKAEAVASRKASQIALEVFTKALPELLGGSADLTGSNLTNTSSTAPLRFADDGHPVRDGDGRPGRHINYGVREFGMAAIMNGIALHGGFIPYGGTFLTFSDYSRNAIRMAALMRRRVIHVFTHDSIGLGEDGPTHQSVEHAASLRLIPNLDVWRPADTDETLVAWRFALQQDERPTAMLLARQSSPHLRKASVADIGKGAYVLSEPADVGLKRKPQAVLIATGTEVVLALQAQAELAALRIAVSVVSMPSTTVFDRQDAAYQQSVLPAQLPRVAIEAGVTDGWWKYGCAAVIGLDRFGESAPASVLFKHFHFTPQNVVDVVRKVLMR